MPLCIKYPPRPLATSNPISDDEDSLKFILEMIAEILGVFGKEEQEEAEDKENEEEDKENEEQEKENEEQDKESEEGEEDEDDKENEDEGEEGG